MRENGGEDGGEMNNARAAGPGSPLTFDGAPMEEAAAAAAAALWLLSDLLAVCSSANTPIVRPWSHFRFSRCQFKSHHGCSLDPFSL